MSTSVTKELHTRNIIPASGWSNEPTTMQPDPNSELPELIASPPIQQLNPAEKETSPLIPADPPLPTTSSSNRPPMTQESKRQEQPVENESGRESKRVRKCPKRYIPEEGIWK